MANKNKKGTDKKKETTNEAGKKYERFNLSRRPLLKGALTAGLFGTGISLGTSPATAQGIAVTDLTDNNLPPKNLAESLIADDGGSKSFREARRSLAIVAQAESSPAGAESSTWKMVSS